MTVGWQKIETAPKDGTKFLAYTEDGVIVEMQASTAGFDGSFMNWEGPYSDGLSANAAYSVGNPVAWMPLPSPPEVE